MNRFKIILGKEEEFETIWQNRETYLNIVDGFKDFHLIKGEAVAPTFGSVLLPEPDGHTLYASHSIWHSKIDFVNWTKSEEFKMAHKKADSKNKLYIGNPHFEGFSVIL